jgi:hypothetical protein
MGYTTGEELKALILSRAGDDAVSPDFGSEVEDYINTSYIAVLEDFPWLFARKTPPGVLNTVAEITTGSVTLTTDSASGTFSSAPTASVEGRKIRTDADGIVCRIIAHTAGQTGFTLDSTYQGDGGSGLTYAVFQDEYDLASDFLAPVNTGRFLRDCHGSYDMDLISPGRMDAEYPYRSSSGVSARYCAIIGDGVLRIAPYPTEARRYEYDYTYHPGALTFDGVVSSDTPIIQPPEDRMVLVYAAAGELLVDMNDDRFASFAAAGPEKLKHMKARQRRMLKPGLYVRSQFSVGARR